MAIPKAALPLSFNVEIGAYIGAIRASLDILATSLSHRFQIKRPDSMQFPILGDASEFQAKKYRGKEFIDGLPAMERALVESLKPYKGGNAALWVLHQLDIVRKHRRLLVVELTPNILTIRGFGGLHFEAAERVPRLDANSEAELGVISTYAPHCKFEITPNVLIDETDIFGPVAPKAVAALYELGSYCQSVIRLFEKT